MKQVIFLIGLLLFITIIFAQQPTAPGSSDVGTTTGSSITLQPPTEQPIIVPISDREVFTALQGIATGEVTPTFTVYVEFIDGLWIYDTVQYSVLIYPRLPPNTCKNVSNQEFLLTDILLVGALRLEAIPIIGKESKKPIEIGGAHGGQPLDSILTPPEWSSLDTTWVPIGDSSNSAFIKENTLQIGAIIVSQTLFTCPKEELLTSIPLTYSAILKNGILYFGVNINSKLVGILILNATNFLGNPNNWESSLNQPIPNNRYIVGVNITKELLTINSSVTAVINTKSKAEENNPNISMGQLALIIACSVGGGILLSLIIAFMTKVIHSYYLQKPQQIVSKPENNITPTSSSGKGYVEQVDVEQVDIGQVVVLNSESL